MCEEQTFLTNVWCYGEKTYGCVTVKKNIDIDIFLGSLTRGPC